jgi:hypothetical protein
MIDTLAPPPDWVKNRATGAVPFDQGKLTDRRRAVTAPSARLGKSDWTDWAVGYGENIPVRLEVRLDQPHPVSAVKFWLCGSPRGAAITADGRKFRFNESAKTAYSPDDVREVVFTLPEPVTTDRLTVELDATPARLIIAEMEVWGP